mgnify:CR=1 FL=1
MAAANGITYPPTRRDMDKVFHYPSPSLNKDVGVVDPYHWLEDPKLPEVQQWVQDQVQCYEKYLKESNCQSLKEKFESVLTGVMNYPRPGCPSRHGEYYYFFYNNGLQNQSILYRVKEKGSYRFTSVEEDADIVLDPNTMATDGTVSVSSTKFSECGKYIAYKYHKSGSDWGNVRVLYVGGDEIVPPKLLKNGTEGEVDYLQWVKFSGLSWMKDGSGFFYSRYPVPKSLDNGYEEGVGEEVDTAVNQKVYFHRLGATQTEDELVYFDESSPEYMYGASVSNCGRYVILTVSKDCAPRNLVYIARLSNEKSEGSLSLTFQPLIEEWDASYSYLHNYGDIFLFKSNKNAEKNCVLAVDISQADGEKRQWHDVIPEHTEDVLENYIYVKDALVLSYLHNASERMCMVPLSAAILKDALSSPSSSSAASSLPTTPISFPGIGSLYSISGRHDRSEIFYHFAGFTDPGSVWRVETSQSLAPELVYRTSLSEGCNLDMSLCDSKQVWYTSKDGTRIPMFVIGRKDVLETCEGKWDGKKQGDASSGGDIPIMLYGYGGFDISLTPYFSAARLIFTYHMKGLYCIANIRGGGEFGKQWHEAGIKEKKQNVFDDFIGAAKYLVETNITRPSKIAINGGSNGGLLVTACINQAPDMFAAAVSQVPVTDMLRFHKFTIGHAWRSDYGSSEEGGFDYLYKYSPLHNIAPQIFPHVLVCTADHDDRVSPLHSYKYISELQHVAGGVPGQRPLLIRIEQKAGHGAGKPIAKIIAEASEIWGFVGNALGCTWEE